MLTTAQPTPKGLTATVYYNDKYRACAAGGISTRVESVTVVGTRQDHFSVDSRDYQPLAPNSRVFDATPERPAVVLVYRMISGQTVVHAEPVQDPPVGHTPYVAGGSYIGSSDSRFGELVGFYGAVALHDRTDTWADYDALTR